MFYVFVCFRPAPIRINEPAHRIRLHKARDFGPPGWSFRPFAKRVSTRLKDRFLRIHSNEVSA
jgi:hypothetical protein